MIIYNNNWFESIIYKMDPHFNSAIVLETRFDLPKHYKMNSTLGNPPANSY